MPAPRFLRLDAGNHGNGPVGPWFSKHKSVCDDKWLCEEEPCKSVPDIKRQHFLLCKRHVNESKEQVKDFAKAQDSKFMNPDTWFYFSSLEENNSDLWDSCMFSQPVESFANESLAVYSANTMKGSDEAMDIDIDVPLVYDPPIYMVQTTPSPSGESLRLFFDSGCYGALLNHKAYKYLTTQTICSGPNLLNVAADEEFRLYLFTVEILPVVRLYMEEEYLKTHRSSADLPHVSEVVLLLMLCLVSGIIDIS